MSRVAPRGNELVRLEAHRGSLVAAITVTPLQLPPYAGNVTSGLLPVYEDSYVRRLLRSLARVSAPRRGERQADGRAGLSGRLPVRAGRPLHLGPRHPARALATRMSPRASCCTSATRRRGLPLSAKRARSTGSKALGNVQLRDRLGEMVNSFLRRLKRALNG